MIKSSKIIIIFCLFFLIIKVFSISLTNFDLFGDEAQYWAWSKNLDFGYFSKPPLLPWFIHVYCLVFGDSFFALKMISISIYCLTSFLIYLISMQLNKNKELSTYAAIAFFLMPGVTVSSFLLSTDVLLILFWSLALLQLLKIKKNPNFYRFVLLGIFVGLAFLTKYAGIYFFICLFFYILVDKKIRTTLLKNKLSALFFIFTFILVIFPNVIWNIQNNWITFQHTADNASLDRTAVNIRGGAEFVFSQIIMIGPILFLCLIFIIKKIKIDENSIFLLSFSLPVFFIVLIEALIVRANANWAAVSLIAFLLFFVNQTYIINKKIIIWNNYLNFFIGTYFFYLIAISSNISAFDRINGITEFSESLDKITTNYKHLVIGDRMLFSNIKYIYRNKKTNLLTPFAPGSKIGHHFQTSSPLLEKHNDNFLYIGYIDQIKYLSNKKVIKLLESREVIFSNETLEIYEVVF